ncbi:hypothetical protein ACXYL9_05355 [Qipengyuania sp. CAU 1752]
MEIGRLCSNPGNKSGQLRIFEQFGATLAEALQLGIGEIGVDGAVADRMHRDCGAPLLRLGYEMVPLPPRRDRAFA